MTPVEQWENFLKLNRQATANAYGVLVSDYLDQTNASPTEAAINDTYEAGKDRYPNEQSAEPGLHDAKRQRLNTLSPINSPLSIARKKTSVKRN